MVMSDKTSAQHTTHYYVLRTLETIFPSTLHQARLLGRLHREHLEVGSAAPL
jgi:hypothetical protein